MEKNKKELKRKLRKEIIEKRDNLSQEYRTKSSNEIWNKIYDNLYFKESKNIFLFLNFGSEVETISRVEEILKLNKRVYIPKIIEKKMKLIEIFSLDNLEKSKMGILEPKSELVEENIIKSEKDIDFVVVPGVVFDEFGYRVGYGGGYYDKFMSKLSPTTNKIAIAFEIQVLKGHKVPNESWDIRLDSLITEKEIRNFIE